MSNSRHPAERFVRRSIRNRTRRGGSGRGRTRSDRSGRGSQAEDPSIKVRTFAVTFQGGYTDLPGRVAPPHTGAWHQLIYATRGVMTVRTDQGAWVVPPHRAVWIPAGVQHKVELSGVVAVRLLYIRADLRRNLFPISQHGCSVVNVTPLLRELIVRANLVGALDVEAPEQKRLMEVIFDELKALTTAPLQLPLPQDHRAARFAALANAGVDEGASMETILRKSGASRRTMERLFQQETAMSLGQWLRRQKLLHALRRLAAGDAVNTVALELGYNSASAFIAMFKKELGQTPKRYFEI